MHDVFISYSREDVAKAELLTRTLEEAGLSVWWDRTVPPGKTWDEVIGAALDAAACAIVLWSAASVGSRWVREEADRALRRECLVPALLERVDPPFGFGRIECADLAGWDGDESHPEVRNLIAAVEEYARSARPETTPSDRPSGETPPVEPSARGGEPTEKPPRPVATTTRSRPRARRAIALAAGAGLLVIATVSVVVWTNRDGTDGETFSSAEAIDPSSVELGAEATEADPQPDDATEEAQTEEGMGAPPMEESAPPSAQLVALVGRLHDPVASTRMSATSDLVDNHSSDRGAIDLTVGFLESLSDANLSQPGNLPGRINALFFLTNTEPGAWTGSLLARIDAVVGGMRGGATSMGSQTQGYLADLERHLDVIRADH